jgi:hypothetical protein
MRSRSPIRTLQKSIHLKLKNKPNLNIIHLRHLMPISLPFYSQLQNQYTHHLMQSVDHLPHLNIRQSLPP